MRQQSLRRSRPVQLVERERKERQRSGAGSSLVEDSRRQSCLEFQSGARGRSGDHLQHGSGTWNRQRERRRPKKSSEIREFETTMIEIGADSCDDAPPRRLNRGDQHHHEGSAIALGDQEQLLELIDTISASAHDGTDARRRSVHSPAPPGRARAAPQAAESIRCRAAAERAWRPTRETDCRQVRPAELEPFPRPPLVRRRGQHIRKQPVLASSSALAFNRGRRPAATSDDFPDPEPPTTSTNRFEPLRRR